MDFTTKKYYYEYNEISEPDFSYTSDKSFEKNSPLQYSSVKLFLSKRISKSKRTTLSVGFDFRVNWGYKIIMDDFERNDISFGGKQDLGGTPLLGDFTQLYQFNSELEKNLSINPLIGLDYDFNILNQKSLTFGVLYSIPLFRILSSNVVIYPDYDDLRSTFNTKYYGGFFGFRVIYSMPIGMCQ